jgi:hypothetical protein
MPNNLEWFRAEVRRLEGEGLNRSQALSYAWQRVKRRMKEQSKSNV